MPKKKAAAIRNATSLPCLRGHLWIEGNEGTFLGYGRISLLERIREYGSITKAAKSLEMSYRRAWVLIDSMNRQAPVPFVVTATGGRRGGGTQLTRAGEKAIVLFWKIHDDFQDFLKKEELLLHFSASPRKKGIAQRRTASVSPAGSK